MGSATVRSRVIPWANKKEVDFDRAILSMATDIDRTSAILAPKLTRALVNSKRIIRKGVAHYSVVYGGGSVPYARRRHYENRKNPGTLLYLERAGDAASRNIRKYVK